jgi:hypothetical protein
MGSLPSPLSSRGPLRHKPNLDENATTPLSFRGIIGLRSTEGDENCFPLVLLSVPNRGVIPTGAKRRGGKWRDLQFRGPFLEMFFASEEQTQPTADPQ